MANDTHICGNCQAEFTSMEEFAKHKYIKYGLRFELIRSVRKTKPQIYYPKLVQISDAYWPKAAVKKEKKKRMTFNRLLMDEGKSEKVNTENQCDKCPRKFRNEKSLQDHRKNVHHVYRCDLCPESEQYEIIGQDALDKHIITHVWKFPCTSCDKRYQSKAGLRLHVQKIHEKKDVVKKAKVAKVSKRDQRSNPETPRLDAESSIEGPEPGEVVDTSQETPLIDAQLSTEDPGEDMTESSEQTYNIICNVCKRFYHSTAELLKHLIHTHITLTPHQCSLCTFSCTKRTDLASHMITQHDQQLPVNKNSNHTQHGSVRCCVKDPGEDMTESSEQTYNIICNVCKRFYHSTAELLKHLIHTHITLTPHQCSSCTFSCTKRTDLASHMIAQHDQQLPVNKKLDSLEVDQHGNLIITADVPLQELATKQVKGQSSENKATDLKSDAQASFLETLGATRTLETHKVDEENQDQGDTDDNENNDGHAASMTEGNSASEERVVTYELEVAVDDQIVQVHDVHAEGDLENYLNRKGSEEESGTVSENLKEDNLTESEQDLQDDEIAQALDQLTAVETILSSPPEPAISPKNEPVPDKTSQSTKQWACSICQRAFICLSYLKIHLRKHTGERPFPCPHCEKAFITKDSLDKHSHIHSDERRYKCGECGKLFKRMAHVRVHLIHTHSDEKLHPCRTCNKRFKTKTAMNAHGRTHSNLRPHRCLTCSKSFREPGTLKRHLRVHTGERLFKCLECGKSFSDKSVLNRHMKNKVPCNKKRRTKIQREVPVVFTTVENKDEDQQDSENTTTVENKDEDQQDSESGGSGLLESILRSTQQPKIKMRISKTLDS